jgi:hypothetical protein
VGHPKAPSSADDRHQSRFAGAVHDDLNWHERVAEKGRDLGLRGQSEAATPLFEMRQAKPNSRIIPMRRRQPMIGTKDAPRQFVRYKKNLPEEPKIY